MKRLLGAVLAATLAVGPAAAAAPSDIPTVACEQRSEPVPQGRVTLVEQRPSPGAEERITEYTLHSPALGRDTRVNVLFPPDFDPGASYPVLYLLHGAAGNHRDWQTLGAVRRVVDETVAAHDLDPFLVVMPDAGDFGFYSDWFGLDITGHNGTGQPPAWATHHIRELIPWIDEHLPTLADRTGRAVAGLSMGGFGAMTYATRFPDLFAAAGSFSGALNPSYGYPYGNVFLTGASGVFTGRGFDQCTWGEFTTQKVRWMGADPVYLAGNLQDTDMVLYVASGGGYLEQPRGFVTDPVEQTCYQMSRAFTDALDDHGVPVIEDFYAEGGHDWAYWQRGVRTFLPIMAEAFAHEPQAPAAFSYRSAEPTFTAWDWSFAVERDVTEFVYLDEVGPGGLTAVGSGQLLVTTAATYSPDAHYEVVHHHTGAAVAAKADEEGRLEFTVDLGPSNAVQQVLFEDWTTQDWTRATVTIDVAGG